MKEITVEDYFVGQAKARGGVALKIAPVSFVGLPDRMALLPRGRVGFCELKKPDEEPSAIQGYWLSLLSSLGFVAQWCATKRGVDAFYATLDAQ